KGNTLDKALQFRVRLEVLRFHADDANAVAYLIHLVDGANDRFARGRRLTVEVKKGDSALDSEYRVMATRLPDSIYDLVGQLRNTVKNQAKSEGGLRCRLHDNPLFQNALVSTPIDHVADVPRMGNRILRSRPDRHLAAIALPKRTAQQSPGVRARSNPAPT